MLTAITLSPRITPVAAGDESEKAHDQSGHALNRSVAGVDSGPELPEAPR
jgi:hypothetical protein